MVIQPYKGMIISLCSGKLVHPATNVCSSDKPHVPDRFHPNCYALPARLKPRFLGTLIRIEAAAISSLHRLYRPYTPHVAGKPERAHHLKKDAQSMSYYSNALFTECIFYHNLLSFIKIKKPRVSNHKLQLY